MTTHLASWHGAVDQEIMTFGFPGHSGSNSIPQGAVTCGNPQGRATICGIVLTKEHRKRAGAGDAHAIATLAESMGHRRDETNTPAGLSHPHICLLYTSRCV